MSSNTYIALDKVTLSSNQGAVTFSNIPQTYTDLRLVISGGFVDNGFTFGARVGNGSVDTGGNYSYQVFRGNGSVVNSYAKSNMIFGALMQQGKNDLNNVITVDFLNYSNTTTNKTWICRYGNAQEGTDSTVTTWRSTSAINTISISECGDGGSGSFNYGNMLSGTTFSLYGIKAWSAESTPKATGGYVSEDSTYYYHTFLFSGTFTPSQSLTCDYLVVAGGGGSGGGTGGGGGAGGLRSTVTSTGGGGSLEVPLSLTAQSYTVTVGSGGAGNTGNGGNGIAGSNSVFATITSTGGGLGAHIGASGSGGSGGGGGYSGGAAGAGTSGQGYSGGNGGGGDPNYVCGGGGGAGSAGSAASGSSGGAGGNGVWTALSNAAAIGQISEGNYYVAGGGAGGTNSGTKSGGLGGGGSTTRATDGIPGMSSTGGGGGGASPGWSSTNTKGGNGGSGVVIVRYAKA